MKIKEIIDALERFAPLPLQDGFDNAGLQTGLTGAEATGALLCLDVTEDVVDEAITLGMNLVVAHHPLLFHGLKSLTGRDYVERCLMKAVKNDIVPPTINHEEGDNDPEIDYNLNFTFNKAQKREVRAAMSNTFGFGGHNACVIFKKYAAE